MPFDQRIIFGLNVLLIISIVAAWAYFLALRNIATTEEMTMRRDPVRPATAVAMPATAEPDDTAVALQTKAKALRGDIRTLRRESDQLLEQLHQHAEEIRKSIEEYESSHPRPPLPERITLGELAVLQEERPLEYQMVEERLLRDAIQRIRARQVVFEALENSSLADRQLDEISEYFDALDAFDAHVSVRDYTREEFERINKNPHWQKLDELIQQTLPSTRVLFSHANLSKAIMGYVPGPFIFLHDDFQQLHW